MQKLVILSGAGISQESGISTFRDANGLWENHDIMEVASIQGWHNNPELVLDFYNQRRRQLVEVIPNKAHTIIAQLEDQYEVTVITQNVDDLHERSGSSRVIHLHGELYKACSEGNKNLVLDWKEDIKLGDLAEDGSQLRPFIVWFGEDVPLLDLAADMVYDADILIVIGTSLQVYPAANLIHFAHNAKRKYIIDPHCQDYTVPSDFVKLAMKATEGMAKVRDELVG
ncbi:MAG: Sir2 family NAD-dependent protein deacetylase [Chitinophagales bacterium]|jgi:NAD-dependent deacetylase|nr:NAD-dependent deacylase [Sphingobacteriales bacterium]